MNAVDTPGTRRRSTNATRIQGGIAEINGKSGEERGMVSNGNSVSTRGGSRA